MTQIKDQIDQSIALLYDYADKYNTSVQMIQKLTQLLRLETFIDKHAHSVNSSIHKLPYQRLTIAGSLILLDIDFIEDSKILSVSLSLANHTSEENEGESEFGNGGMEASFKSSVGGENIEVQFFNKTCTVESVLVGNEQEMINIVNVNFAKNDASFLNSSLETILYNNLVEKKLGYFPRNLKHLSLMDTLSHENVDLFLYFDNILLIFYLIYAIELQQYQKKENSGVYFFTKGYINSIGRATLNSANELGIFVDYWRDFRFINRQTELQPQSLAPRGQCYNYCLEVRDSNTTNINYLSNLKDEIWKFSNQTFQFSFDGDSYLTNANNGNATVSIPSNGRNENWCLWVVFNYPVPIPAYLLEYLAFEDYQLESSNDENEIRLNGKFNYVDGYKFEFISNLPELNVPFVKAIRLNALRDLNTLVPILRNTLVLRNVLDTFKQQQCITEDIHMDKDTVDSNSIEFSPEYKAKLKQSLKLSSHVTDEELMALNALTSKKQEPLALDAFMRDYENDNGSASTNDPLTIDVEDESDSLLNKVPLSNTIYFLIDNIDLMGSNDISLQIYGDISQEVNFRISNGEFKTDDDKLNKFVATLNLTENLHKALALIM
ncbi:uncharacterized protein KQ657_005111 [Scheffersomyces spartinae]|uniref:Mediator of RNA polymerase II transcription subunit 1 n=1 Tax=Scheffersomyces spartinae TaxID=45513 RepID=A0A9P7V9S6_9ASCO|nr:uncharacterized protein KQ657_005111 [Scheffersomyces spartinae]KAG7193912.1 hypothetical protein KQ657_005111 [Scheffersomyces spartinae]